MSENLIELFAVLPANLSNHLMITVIPLAIGLCISIPLAVVVARHPKFRYPTLTVVSVIQTIPSLALLALMVPIIAGVSVITAWLIAGFEIRPLGAAPAIVGLTLYSMLPMVRNTVTGILGVDAPLVEAARGVGMTPRQILWKVELPLAAPVIIAGIRTATVWVVGIATLATPVGQRCLGNFIFRGLQTWNWTAVLFGCVAAAGLAIVLDLLLGGVERAVRERRPRLGNICIVILLAILVGGVASPFVVRAMQAAGPQFVTADPGSDEAATDTKDTVVHIGAKTFTEQYILAQAIERTLQDAGFQTRVSESLGSTVVFQGLAKDDLDVYVEYSGTVWANYMDRDDAAPPWKIMAVMSGWLADAHGIRCLGTLGFENAYALAMRRDQAGKLGIRTVADLAVHAPEMRIGGDYEFFGRPEWRSIRDTYGLNFADQISYDSTFMYGAVNEGIVDVISAFSSDGRIEAMDLVVLEDPAHAIPPYDAVLLLSARGAQREDLVAALKPLLGAIPVEMMREANYMVDRAEDKQTVSQAAEWLLEQIATGDAGETD